MVTKENPDGPPTDFDQRVKELRRDFQAFKDQTKEMVKVRESIEESTASVRETTARLIAQRSPRPDPPPSAPAAMPAPTEQLPKLEEIFGRTSNAARANALCLKNPDLYRRLKAEAIKRGLL